MKLSWLATLIVGTVCEAGFLMAAEGIQSENGTAPNPGLLAWEPENGAQAKTRLRNDNFSTMAFLPDGKKLVCGNHCRQRQDRKWRNSAKGWNSQRMR